jgi:CBS-domain-containing membrane protein
MKVRDVMSSEVRTATGDTPYKVLLEHMLRHQISGLPIVDANGFVAGIVTEADLIKKVAFAGHRDRHAVLTFLSRLLTGHEAVAVLRVEGITAAEIMSQPVISIAPDDEVDHAARVMLAHHVKRLPVLDATRHLVGLVSRRDLMRIFHVPDPEIAAAVERTLANPLSAPEAHDVTASVADGVVTLTGTVEYPSDIDIVSSVVAAVAGVVGVRSTVTAREPEPRLDNVHVPLAP